MPTDLLFRDDAYAADAEATVLAVGEKGIVLDRTVFYAMGGGQPGDVGTMRRADGTSLEVTNAVWNDEAKSEVAHVLAPGAASPAIGEKVAVSLDWPRRYARMKVHTALHLLSVAGPSPSPHTFSNGKLILLRFSIHSGTGRFFERMKSGLKSLDW